MMQLKCDNSPPQDDPNEIAECPQSPKDCTIINKHDGEDSFYGLDLEISKSVVEGDMSDYDEEDFIEMDTRQTNLRITKHSNQSKIEKKLKMLQLKNLEGQR